MLLPRHLGHVSATDSCLVPQKVAVRHAPPPHAAPRHALHQQQHLQHQHQWQASPPAASATGSVSRRRAHRLVARDSGPAASQGSAAAATAGTRPQLSQRQAPDSSSSSEAAAAAPSQEQEIKGLRQLLLQQQDLIVSLQQDVQALKGAVLLQQQQQQHPSSSTSSSPRSSSSEQSAPDLLEQQQQPQQPAAHQPMSLETFQALPDKIILVRHAESLGNVDATTYRDTPDYEVPLSAAGWDQAVACGHQVRAMMEREHGGPSGYKIFFMTSPYCRTRQTFVGIRQAFPDENFAGVQEEVQLREQDFGNFQNPAKIQQDLAERNRFGRFYYRFPDGESGSDVFNRVSIFEDHLIRDMKAGRFSSNTSLCLVTHGLTMRVFLMRFFNWTVESFLQVFNPPNATPIVVEKISQAEYLQQAARLGAKRQTLLVKQAYRLRGASKSALKMNTVATTDHIDLVHHTYT